MFACKTGGAASARITSRDESQSVTTKLISSPAHMSACVNIQVLFFFKPGFNLTNAGHSAALQDNRKTRPTALRATSGCSVDPHKGEESKKTPEGAKEERYL